VRRGEYTRTDKVVTGDIRTTGFSLTFCYLRLEKAGEEKREGDKRFVFFFWSGETALL
jgi:hypothetical protein